MINSRQRLRDEKPHNSSKGKGIILETPYKPGFVDDKDLETVKMAVDKELSEISNAFYQTIERTADTITRIDKIEIEGDNLLAKIEEVDRVSKEGDIALAERITTLTATVDDNSAKITEETRVRTDADSALAERITKLEADTGDDWKAAIEEEKIARVDADGALASQITTLKAQSEAGDATLTQNMTVIADKTGKLEAKWGVSTNVNGKITGISLNNDGKTGIFAVQADKFTISNGTSDTIAPFEVVGANTRIKSALVETLTSDNWNGSTTGWAITKAGYANFQGVTVRGNIIADNGTFNGTVNANNGIFNNVTIKGTCTYEGQISSNQIQDTAVTAVVKASNNINVIINPGGGQEINAVMSTATVNIARNYARTVQFSYPGAITLRAQKGGSGTKTLLAKIVMYYNGSVIGEGLFLNKGTQDNIDTQASGVVVGVIPANTTGTIQVNYYLYYQDNGGLTMIAPSQNSQFSIFKTSSEIS